MHVNINISTNYEFSPRTMDPLIKSIFLQWDPIFPEYPSMSVPLETLLAT